MSFCGSCYSYVKYQEPKDDPQKAAVVHLKACGSQGSGAVISPTEIITAYHVVDGCDALQEPVIVISGLRMGKAEVVFKDKDRDVARLRMVEGVDVLPKMRARVAKDVKEGSYLCVETAIPDKTRLCGHVKSVSGTINLGFAGIFGNSGSAVYDDRGDLVGVLSMVRFCNGGGFTYTCGTLIAPVLESDFTDYGG